MESAEVYVGEGFWKERMLSETIRVFRPDKPLFLPHKYRNSLSNRRETTKRKGKQKRLTKGVDS